MIENHEWCLNIKIASQTFVISAKSVVNKSIKKFMEIKLPKKEVQMCAISELRLLNMKTIETHLKA